MREKSLLSLTGPLFCNMQSIPSGIIGGWLKISPASSIKCHQLSLPHQEVCWLCAVGLSWRRVYSFSAVFAVKHFTVHQPWQGMF